MPLILIVAAVVLCTTTAMFPLLLDDEWVLSLLSDRGVLGSPRPLRALTLLLDRAIAGNNPAWMHASNALMHVVTGWLFYELLRRRAGMDTAGATLALVLFLFSPVMLDAVGIVANRKESLATIGIIGGCLLATDRRRNRLRILAACAAFACAAFSKETSLVFPLLIASVDVATERSSGRTAKTLRHLAAWCAYAALLGVLVYVQMRWSMTGMPARPETITDRPGFLPVGATICDGFRAFVWSTPRLLALSVMPFGHASIHSGAPAAVMRASLVWESAFLVVCAVGTAWIVFRKKYYYPLLWIFASIAPTLFPPMIAGRYVEVLSERYLYLGSAGMAWATASIVGSIRNAHVRRVVGAVVCVSFVVSTAINIPHYKSEEAFWHRILEVDPESWQAELHLARKAEHDGLVNMAGQYYQRMTEKNPDSEFCICIYAEFLARMSKLPQAISVLNRYATRCGGSAQVDIRLAEYFDRVGKIAEARGAASRAMQLLHGDKSAMWRLALLEEAMGNWSKAISLHRTIGSAESLERAEGLSASRIGHNLCGKILIVGDSVPAGYNLKSGSLAELLGDMLKETKIESYTENGITAMELSRHFRVRLSRMQSYPDKCYIMAGHNDAFRGVPPHEIIPFIIRIAADCAARGIEPIIIGPMSVRSTPERDRRRQEQILADLNALLSDFCRRQGLRFVDIRKRMVETGVTAEHILDPSTGNHLNATGMSMLADYAILDGGCEPCN